MTGWPLVLTIVGAGTVSAWILRGIEYLEGGKANGKRKRRPAP